MVLGFNDYSFVGLFSTEEKAKELGCISFEKVDENLIHDDRIVYALKVTIGTFFDQDIEWVVPVKEPEDVIKAMAAVVQFDFLKEVCDDYESRLTKTLEDVTFSPEETKVEDIIADINLLNLELEVDEDPLF